MVGVDFFNTDGLVSENTEIYITCPYFFHQFKHSLQFAQGDPRNIALIGHWDGWQPFSTSAKHGCGKLVNVHS